MTDTVKNLNQVPISRHCHRQLKKWGEFPRPDQLHPLQLLEVALEKELIRDDLQPEVLFLLRIAPKAPHLVGRLLGLKEKRLHQAEDEEEPIETVRNLLELVEAAASEGEFPENIF